MRQIDDEGLDYQFKDRQYLQHEGEIRGVHLNLQVVPAGSFLPAFPYAPGFMNEALTPPVYPGA
jgi:hypothetical protein